MKRSDVLKVDEIRDTLDQAIGQVNTAIAHLNVTLRDVFGQMVFALDTVIDAHNTLETRQADLERRMLLLEQTRGQH
jgi:hypothetical protein